MKSKEEFISKYNELLNGKHYDQIEAAKVLLVGKTISNIEVVEGYDYTLIITTTDGIKYPLVLPRECCENKYWEFQSTVSDFTGATILDFELVKSDVMEEVCDEGGYIESSKEWSFFRIITDKGVFTATAYNEHNGHYEGITLDYFDIDDVSFE